MSKLYHLFIDESGDHSLANTNKDFPVFVLLGCLFEDIEYSKVCTEMRELKNRIFGTSEVIFHSRDIRKCEGAFVKLFDLNVKKDFYEGVNKLIRNSHFQIIGVGIKKEDFIKKYGKIADDPYELSLSFLLERAVLATNHPSEEVQIQTLIESRGKKEDEVLLRRYNRLLDRGSGYISPEKFKCRLSTLDFHRKNQNDCGLQIADLCAYPIARKIVNPKELYPSYDIVNEKFRKSASGKIIGYGLKLFP